MRLIGLAGHDVWNRLVMENMLVVQRGYALFMMAQLASPVARATVNAVRELVSAMQPALTGEEGVVKRVNSVDRITQLTAAGSKSMDKLWPVDSVYVDREAMQRLRTMSDKPDFIENLLTTAASDLHRLVRKLMLDAGRSGNSQLQAYACDLSKVAGERAAERLKTIQKFWLSVP